MPFGFFAQEQLTLEECYQLVEINYPLAQQNVLLENQTTIDLEVINTEKLPQLNFSAQTTYQSEVIEIPLPESSIEPINKDQYRATASVNQLIYAGGIVNAKTNLAKATLATRQKKLEVDLYQLKRQVNKLYFSILLSQEKNLLLQARKSQLQTKINEVKSGIEYGVLLPTSNKTIESELLLIEQQLTEVDKNKIVLIETLSALVGKDFTAETVFQQPIITTDLSDKLKRPELELFQIKKQEIQSSEQLLSKQNSPKLIGFADAGYGNPGLNMLDNSFQTFYVVGLKLNWKVFDWNANQKQRESLLINQGIVDSETETYKLNTNIELNQQLTEINKFSDFIATDAEIIQLRKEILNAAESQLRNGVITASAYITELTNLYESENNLIIHNIQLQLAKANYNIIKGQ
jgi:outer membrane protein TolC